MVAGLGTEFIGNAENKLAEMVSPKMVPALQPVFVEMGSELGKFVPEVLVDPKTTTLLREEIEALMTERLEFLTPEIVKTLIEDVIRDHLGWLVVWGNIFGSIIGIIALTVTGEV
eukprot:gnl/MRDRNA2_/MRDRNA2_70051_c0_seq2.p1 gnl/MRDRNA2_/MRDRNA2_70051_c0~~gnl/MRDRNA2_/MRDRNA2_70051_c0_seq2.p1  ORF type:complete len:115 (+),score=34.11 gnl/MRDRNA2_/MRDRNA2_70051_c0_seq2:138-482(+)